MDWGFDLTAPEERSPITDPRKSSGISTLTFHHSLKQYRIALLDAVLGKASEPAIFEGHTFGGVDDRGRSHFDHTDLDINHRETINPAGLAGLPSLPFSAGPMYFPSGNDTATIL